MLRRLLLSAMVIVLAVSWSDAGARLTCRLGAPVLERALLLPKPRTFYSVDALGPDVVRWHGRYLLYFSGNSVHTLAGRWVTGLAASRSPLGPFGVVAGVRVVLPWKVV